MWYMNDRISYNHKFCFLLKNFINFLTKINKFNKFYKIFNKFF